MISIGSIEAILKESHLAYSTFRATLASKGLLEALLGQFHVQSSNRINRTETFYCLENQTIERFLLFVAEYRNSIPFFLSLAFILIRYSKMDFGLGSSSRFNKAPKTGYGEIEVQWGKERFVILFVAKIRN